MGCNLGHTYYINCRHCEFIYLFLIWMKESLLSHLTTRFMRNPVSSAAASPQPSPIVVWGLVRTLDTGHRVHALQRLRLQGGRGQG
jgi:hypothetical protein